MQSPLVSAIITTHNRKQLLSRAIESVFSQTYSNLELIVVDDASDDGTKLLCEADRRFKYIFIPKEESRGGNYARNLGIKASMGEYIAFLDDDDYWLSEKIEKQVWLILEKECELVHCGRRMEYVTEKGTTYKDGLPDESHQGDMSRKILLTICTTTTCILCSKKALEEVGLFDENLRFWQEYELTIRLAQRKPFYFVNEPLAVYRVEKRDKNRLTNKYYEWKDAVRYIQKKHHCLYAHLGFSEKLFAKSLVLRDGSSRLRSIERPLSASIAKFLGRIISVPYKILLFFSK